MKKIYGMLLLFFVFVTCHAQIKKGSVLLGGQLSYSNGSYQFGYQPGHSSRNASIGVSAGKAIRENNFVGLDVNYISSKETSYYSGGDSVRSKGYYSTIGAFVRSYKKLANNFYIFCQATGGVTIGNQTQLYKSPNGEIKIKNRGTYASLTPGVAYQVFKKMQVEVTIPGIVSLQYMVTRQNSINPQLENAEFNQFAFSTNLNNTNLGLLGVGFRFVL